MSLRATPSLPLWGGLLLSLAACGLWADDEGFHPSGYDAAEQHGLDANRGELVCVNCHAPDLRGDPEIDAVSCDGCHHDDGEDPSAWRTDCVFCHGGQDDLTGAPPEDIRDAPEDATFGAHTAHVSGALVSAPLSCEQCHVMPEAVLSIGHMWDGTPDQAEVDFLAGLSPQSTWVEGSCSDSYCHGDGQGHNGTVAADDAPMTCASCHAGQDSTLSAWEGMSGTHARPHLEGVDGVVATCSDCHSAVVSADDETILDLARHVDGVADVSFDASDPEIQLVYDAVARSCTGTCHGVEHNGYRWDGESPHPDDYDLAALHGVDANLAVLTEGQHCAECHGADLLGGEGVSCDGCHHADGEEPSAWRTDCLFCHGGQDDLTGAPPEDIRGAAADTAFGAHTAHVSAAWVRTPLTCEQCHVVPDDVLSIGHMWDGTAGQGEVDFSAGLSVMAAWSGGTCSDSYCHGDGQGHNGTVAADAAPVECSSCHASQSSGRREWERMSGTHSDPHLEGDDGIVATCSDCHSSVVATNDRSIVGLDLHIDGQVQVVFDPSAQISMTYNASRSTCTGRCHGENHSNEDWFDREDEDDDD